MDEGDLSFDIPFGDTNDLPLPDLIHGFVPTDCSLGTPENNRPGGHLQIGVGWRLRNIIFVFRRRLMKRWSCSRRLFGYLALVRQFVKSLNPLEDKNSTIVTGLATNPDAQAFPPHLQGRSNNFWRGAQAEQGRSGSGAKALAAIPAKMM